MTMRTTLSVTITAALALVLGCAATGHHKRTITAQIDGGAGKMLYFDKFTSNRPVHVDSVMLDKKGKGVMKVPTMPLDFYSLSFGDKDMLVLLLDSLESVKVEAKADSLQQPILVEGSVNTSLLHGFFKDAMAYDKERQALIDHLTANRGDSAAMHRFTELNTAFTAHTKEFVRSHPSSPAVLAAMSRLDPRKDLPLFEAVRDSLAKAIPHSQYFAGYRDQVDRMVQQAQAAKEQEQPQAKLDQLIPVGSVAPDFTQTTPEGTKLSLSDLRGKVVLIDFWASWCRPCRMEMPNVKKAYAVYHPKGLEVLGVSLDKTKDAWTGAIKQDGLTWKHVSDLAFWNNAAAQLYGVSSIPYSVLVDRDGKVIAKNLRGPALEAKLAEVFK